MAYLVNIFTTLLVIIGLVVIYFDLKKGIIPNRLIASGFLLVIVLYNLFFLYNVFYLQSSPFFEYLLKAFLNGFFCVLLGFLFWKFKFWSAGDGKLFGLFGFLLPLEFYSNSYVNYFPSFALLVNIFIPLLAVLLLKLLIYLVQNKFFLKKVKRRDFFQKGKIIKLFKNIGFHFTKLFLFVITFRSLLEITDYLGFYIDNTIIFIFVLFSFYLYSGIRAKHKMLFIFELLVVFLFVVSLAMQNRFVEIGQYFKIVVFFMIMVVLLRQALLFYVDKSETIKVKAKNIQPGMVLTKNWRNYFSDKISEMNKNDKGAHFQNLKSEGLTARQAEIIRELFQDNPDYEVKTAKTFSLAPFLFLGAMISIITSDSFLSLINLFINNFLV